MIHNERTSMLIFRNQTSLLIHLDMTDDEFEKFKRQMMMSVFINRCYGQGFC